MDAGQATVQAVGQLAIEGFGGFAFVGLVTAVEFYANGTTKALLRGWTVPEETEYVFGNVWGAR
ncbi:MAG TPA: hypothetical protein VGP72_10380 [Planctomycetota bacterium]|jgi:hypothetical protein